MAFLEQFEQQDRDNLVMLPYRAGLWVSMADVSGGTEADFKEMDVLETIIERRAGGMFESAFVHEVMAEMCARQKNWKDWAKDMEAVPEECRRAIASISGRLPPREADAYRRNIMYVATEVARAFREFDATASLPRRAGVWLRLLVERALSVFRGEESDYVSNFNISVQEDKALSALLEALDGERQA